MSVRGFLLVVGVPLLVIVAIACGGGSSSGDMAGHDMSGNTMVYGSPMASPTVMPDEMMSASRTSTDPDLGFIDGMIVHHQSAIDMAKVAQEQGEHQEIKDLANAIITAQQREIDQMKTWRGQWYPTASQTSGMAGMEHAAGMHMTDADMQTLRAANPFDKAFIEMMVPHHESAIVMAKELQKTTTRPELKQLTEHIISDQQREISEMQQWKAAWYGS